MDWFKKHTDTLIVLGSILSSFLWINGQFSEIKKDISIIEKDVAIIKTVLIMKNIYPNELVISSEEK